jgi:hypothetical protein
MFVMNSHRFVLAIGAGLGAALLAGSPGLAVAVSAAFPS